eukprot:5565014-Pleurochrysis_carterae.AAC.2
MPAELHTSRPFFPSSHETYVHGARTKLPMMLRRSLLNMVGLEKERTARQCNSKKRAQWNSEKGSICVLSGVRRSAIEDSRLVHPDFVAIVQSSSLDLGEPHISSEEIAWAHNEDAGRLRSSVGGVQVEPARAAMRERNCRTGSELKRPRQRLKRSRSRLKRAGGSKRTAQRGTDERRAEGQLCRSQCESGGQEGKNKGRGAARRGVLGHMERGACPRRCLRERAPATHACACARTFSPERPFAWAWACRLACVQVKARMRW